jgi:cytochrome c peroxidase
LSSDGIVSCGFCHIQEDALHNGHTLSHGIDNLVGDRNTPSIQNLFSNHFYVRTDHLDLFTHYSVNKPVEMNADLSAVMAMMKADPVYRIFLQQHLQMVKLILKIC